MKNNLYFRLQDDRRLRKAYRKAIVKTDNEFNKLDVEIPRVIDEVDVSDFDYTVKFEVNDKYLEKTPEIRVEQDRLVLSVVVTDLITPVKGRIKFSITGQKGDTKFNSAIGTIEIKDTLHIGDYIEPDMLKVWLDEIKDNIKKFKNDLNSELDNVDKTLHEKIEKEIGEALKELESLKLKVESEFDNYLPTDKVNELVSGIESKVNELTNTVDNKTNEITNAVDNKLKEYVKTVGLDEVKTALETVINSNKDEIEKLKNSDNKEELTVEIVSKEQLGETKNNSIIFVRK